ncbi:MepB family protein [Dokdonia sp.]|uniref:MepB family protein n=1 Tax=Dokdonia sp. TaxID=2024995 RepID=UPI003263367D
MDTYLTHIKTIVYDRIGFEISNFCIEPESKEYAACQFELNGQKIISRNAKITPKKIGQFVTFWKRHENGPIEPFHQADPIDFYVVNVQTKNTFGQFVFPIAILIKKGIISTDNKEGKRAFRVYPSWDIPKSKQAARTQKWQLDYFYEINDSVDFTQVAKLYSIK